MDGVARSAGKGQLASSSPTMNLVSLPLASPNGVWIWLEELLHKSVEPDAEDRPALICSMWSGRAHDPHHLGVDAVPERTSLSQSPDRIQKLWDRQGLLWSVAEDRHQ